MKENDLLEPELQLEIIKDEKPKKSINDFPGLTIEKLNYIIDILKQKNKKSAKN